MKKSNYLEERARMKYHVSYTQTTRVTEIRKYVTIVYKSSMSRKKPHEELQYDKLIVADGFLKIMRYVNRDGSQADPHDVHTYGLNEDTSIAIPLDSIQSYATYKAPVTTDEVQEEMSEEEFKAMIRKEAYTVAEELVKDYHAQIQKDYPNAEMMGEQKSQPSGIDRLNWIQRWILNSSSH